MLYAPTLEERDLWVNGIRRLINVPVKDPFFKPMQPVSKTSLHMTKQYTMCEGSNDSGSVKNDLNSEGSEAVLGRDGNPIPAKIKPAILPKRVQSQPPKPKDKPYLSAVVLPQPLKSPEKLRNQP